MSPSNFDSQLDQILDFSASASDPYGQTYEEIKSIAESIQRKLNDGLTGDPIQVEIEPGFKASLGQQLRINVRIPQKQYRDTLFRAYVPTTGFPISLDLYGENPEECNNAQELQTKVLGFLKQTKERMASYRNFVNP